MPQAQQSSHIAMANSSCQKLEECNKVTVHAVWGSLSLPLPYILAKKPLLLENQPFMYNTSAVQYSAFVDAPSEKIWWRN